MQTKHTRSHYSDYTVISTHVFKQKRDNVERSHTSELVLCINNWHFVKDNLYKAKTSPCQADDCSISIKLSSTVFRSESQANDSEVAVVAAAAGAGEEFYFDKNGAVIPYPALKALLNSAEFFTYMEQVKKQFEEDSGSKAWQEDEVDDGKTTTSTNTSNNLRKTRQDEAEEEEEEEEVVQEDEEEELPLKIKKAKKTDKKK